MWHENTARSSQCSAKYEKMVDLRDRTEQRRDRVQGDMEKIPSTIDNSNNNSKNILDNLQETILNGAFEYASDAESLTSNYRDVNLQIMIIKKAWEYAERKRQFDRKSRDYYLQLYNANAKERTQHKPMVEETIIKNYVDDYSQCYLLLKHQKCYLNAINEKYDLIRRIMRAMEWE